MASLFISARAHLLRWALTFGGSAVRRATRAPIAARARTSVAAEALTAGGTATWAAASRHLPGHRLLLGSEDRERVAHVGARLLAVTVKTGADLLNLSLASRAVGGITPQPAPGAHRVHAHAHGATTLGGAPCDRGQADDLCVGQPQLTRSREKELGPSAAWAGVGAALRVCRDREHRRRGQC